MKKYLIFLFILILLFAKPLFATTYYVDGTAGACSGDYSIASRNCTGSDGTSYATMQAALNAVTGANTILVRAGTYNETATTTGGGVDADNMLIVQNYNSETVNIARFNLASGDNYVKIDGFNIYDPRGGDGSFAGVRVISNYNTITNCTFKVTATGGTSTRNKPFAAKITGSNNTFSNNTVDPTLVTDSYVGEQDGGDNQSLMTDSSLSMTVDALIDYTIWNWTDGSSCVVTDNDATTVTCTLAGGTDNDWDDGDKFQVGPMFWIVFQNDNSNNTYENNTIKNLYDVERIWDIVSTGGGGGDYMVVRGNEVYGCKYSNEPSGGPHPDIFQNQNSDGSTYNRYVTIEDNYFHDNDIQGSNLEMDPPYMQEWTVRNNIWANNTRQWGPKVKATKYHNNLIYNQGGSYPFGFWTDDNTEVINNIIIGDGSADPVYLIDGSGTPEVEDNYWAQGVSGWTTFADTTEITDCDGGEFGATGISGGGWTTLDMCDTGAINGGDPKFVDDYTDCINNTCNFQLSGDSPLLSVGTNLSAHFTDDMDGTTRSAPWDIGPYENEVSESIALTGTLFSNNSESDVQTGDYTVIATISETTFVATAGDDNQISIDIIQGLDGSDSWDTCIDSQDYNDLSCDSTTCTLTIDACAGYAIDSNDTLTWTFPTTSNAAGVQIVATPTIEIIAETEINPPISVSNINSGTLTISNINSGNISISASYE